MKTQILPVSPQSLAYAKELIQAGEVVAFPTETVYGLGADARNDAAVQKIFALKGRPADNPLIAHVHLDEVLTEFDRVVGLKRLKAVHLNDSQNPLGARKDRHARIGEGCIGAEALARVVTHPALSHLPFELETPNELPGYAREIAFFRGLFREE